MTVDSSSILDGLDLPRHEAERIVRAVLGVSRATVLSGLALTHDHIATIERMVELRRSGQPLQYLEGTASFGPIELAVDERVLVPRPETEQLWERLLNELAEGPGVVVDLCTGSGAMALAIKKVRSDLTVIATDVSTDALDVARSNADRLGLDVDFFEGDLFDALDPMLQGSVSAIVSNPPYVSDSEWQQLPAEVRDHEPRQALVADEDGLVFYRRFAEQAAEWLAPDGFLMAEIGETQGEALVVLFASRGWTVDIEFDLAGRDRFVTVRR